MRRSRPTGWLVLAGSLLLTALPATGAERPAPGTPAYLLADAANVAAAYGRQTAPDGQLTPSYLLALNAQVGPALAGQLLEQAASPTRPALTPGALVPGWNVGNPYRAGWDGTRGQQVRVAFPNRYGAQLRGTLYAPLPGARDPYTGEVLRGPFPGVVITPGSVQGSQRMYEWLAQDLAERGYLVLGYDVQGQGTSETLPHTSGGALPSCDPLAAPTGDELFGCPGVPSQQEANFTTGTVDAVDFLLSTPAAPARGAVNPLWQLFDRSPDPRPATPGRTTRLAVVGHSLGGTAVSKVQATDTRVAAVVALDKLQSDGTVPRVPALAVQSEYGFSVTPYPLSGGSSIAPQPVDPATGPDPRRERATGFDAWQAAGVDTALVVPRASTHLEYTDIPLALPASRYGQAVTSHYVQAWLDRYVAHDRTADARLTTERLRYLQPTAAGWRPVSLLRDGQLSGYYCSAADFRLSGGARVRLQDVTGVGC